MTNKILQCLLFLLLSQSAFSNGEESIVTLCSGQEMSWKEYLMYKKLRSDDYDTELESMSNPDFLPHKQSFVNNTIGAWSSVIPMPLIPAAAANMPDGRLITWAAKDKFSFGGDLGRTWTATFDPSNNSSAEFLIEETNHAMFCPGATTLPDGRIMVSGGSSSDKSSTYDPYTGGWSANDILNTPRGYHSQVTLASGATFVIGGSWSGGTGGKDAEVWSEKTGWYNVPGLPVEVTTDGINANQASYQNDYFPWLWVAPNGKLFHAGPSPTMHWIDPEGHGSYSTAGQRGDDAYSINGNTVMYDVGKILKTGGAPTFENGSQSNGKSYIIDINSNSPIVTTVGSLNHPRTYINSVVLPNGEVLVFGGIPVSAAFSDNNSIFIPELWNPNTQIWTEMAPMQTPRNYHSVAILMTDGRIFTGGGGLQCNTCATNHPDAEIYTPPYLFNANGTLATRPVINSAPTTANYNSNINVTANSSISSFSLIRMNAVTHSTNNDQRRIPVSATNLGNNQYQLAISNRNILPPGNYMLFAMNASGVPSVAKVINIGDDINNCTTQGNPVSGGTGLEATYFNNVGLSNPASYTQIDPTIDFSWGEGAPAGLPVDFFSARWEGKIEVPRSGTYTFYTNSDDGVRLWVNDVLMVDNWTNHALTEDIGMIHLEPFQQYDIKLEYFENQVEARIQLSWSGPGLAKGIVPSQNLFPPQVCIVGASCDDGDPNTSNDIYQTDCSCSGTVVGTPDCNNIEVTTSNEAITITGLDGAPIVSVQVFNSSWQTVYSCFDVCNIPTETITVPNGDYFVYVKYFDANYVQVCQINDSYTVSGGPCTDNDNDGVCAPLDCDDNNPNLPTVVGSSCDDGDANTTNDVILADGCTCEGSVTGNNCNGVSIIGSNDAITVSGLSSPISQVQIFSPSWATVLNCSGNCNATEIASSLSSGTYFVKVRLYTASWAIICEVEQSVVVGGSPCIDNDNDGVCLVDDCNDNDPNIPTTVGSPCNDGNPNTINDVILADGCTCLGTDPGCTDNDNDGVCLADDCNDNDPSIPTTVGSPCNDGNPNTVDDVILADGCTCMGIGQNDCLGVTIIGSSNAITVSGVFSPISQVQIFSPSWATVLNCSGNCNSTEIASNLSSGTYFVKVRLYTANWAPICDIEEYVTVGGGPCTDNDNDGICVPQDCNDNDPNLPATVGSACDDNNPNTSNDVIQADGCTCAGSTGGNSCDNINFSFNGADLVVSGLNSEPIAILQVFNGQWATIFSCAGNCNGTETIPNLSSDTYYVKAGLYTSSWAEICLKDGYITGGTNQITIQESEDLFFSAQKDARKVSLNWVTNTEYKNDFFEIERSSNGIDFEVLSDIRSKNENWNVHFNYVFSDQQPHVGNNFYRIKKWHHDGTFNYSDVRKVFFDLNLIDFTLFPNPASDEVFIDLSAFAGEQGTLSIYNQFGQLVLEHTKAVIPTETLRFSTVNFQSGLYLVVAKVGERKVMSRKLVVVRQ